MLKIAPIDARIVFGLNISAQGVIISMFLMLKPKQVLIIVPRFSISLGLTKTTLLEFFCKLDMYFLNTPTIIVLSLSTIFSIYFVQYSILMYFDLQKAISFFVSKVFFNFSCIIIFIISLGLLFISSNVGKMPKV